ELRVTEGQTVKIGETIAIVEAMKMENALHSEQDGTIAKILANVGDSLAADQPILEFGTEAE
ncbi:MAG: acetyl-CoA carboxylase biotin carboxyl carrier protein subunit, partial [Gammaproteobacteria bacterium]|nr:acetyl-CoA carboxylase biotin carboxyl carrier protein subunit [Gammaproteobacteria bacterium]